MTNLMMIHNPRCSKSRETLALLKTHDIDPEVRLYLEDLLTEKEIRDVLSALGMSARMLLRTSEQAYKDLNLKDDTLSENELVQAMCRYPKLIQRPIVVLGDKAKVGRPPEEVLTLFS